MCYECRMFGAGPTLCIVDRKVWKGHGACPTCGQPGIAMGTKWRAPRLTDEAAWRRVEAGDFLWERPVNYVGQRTWTGDRLNLAKKKPQGFGRYHPLSFILSRRPDWEDRIRDEILRRMNGQTSRTNR